MVMYPDTYHWSTTSAPSGRAFDFWADEVRRHVTRIDLSSHRQHDFYGEFRQRRIGPLWFSSLRASAQDAVHAGSRTGGLLSRFDLVCMRTGEMTLEQDSQRVTMRAGDLLLVSHARDFVFTTTESTACYLVACTDDWLRTWLPDPEACVMQPVEGSAPWANSLCSLFGGVAKALENESRLPDGLIADQVGGCAALIYHGSSINATGYRRSLLHALRRSIRAQHCRSDLAPRHIAEQHRISVRYLHAIFASAGTSFGCELRNARLERARSMLRDVSFKNESVSEIALRCGFNDPAYLARLFRQILGVTPSAYRQLS